MNGHQLGSFEIMGITLEGGCEGVANFWMNDEGVHTSTKYAIQCLDDLLMISYHHKNPKTGASRSFYVNLRGAISFSKLPTSR
jgi:hypothetical protein